MTRSAKAKKRIMLAFIIPLFCLVAGGGLIYIFAIYRFKENLRFLVDRESKGKYAFNAREANISLWHRSIRLRESVLSYNPDSAHSPVLYQVRIPEMYFSITSWKNLIFHQKLVVDSLAIIEPDVRILVNRDSTRKVRDNFRASDLLTYLEKTLTHLNVHSFSLKDASFSYKKMNGPAPLQVNHINLSISDFTHVNNDDSHLLGSDNISISMGRQHWILPDGRHKIDFKQLTFDSKGQRFELDSFNFDQKADTGKGEIHLYADKFFFNSRHLPAIYQKGQLLLDTLICINPVLAVPGYNREKSAADSLQRIVFKSDLFNLINIRYVSVIDGEVLVETKDSSNSNVATRKANMSIFNLAVNPTQTPQITTDSVRLNLKKIEFATKDSLYKLTIDEFTILRNDVLFRNVRFGPSESNHSDRGAVFTAPSLLLKDVNITDLLRKRINATVAELNQPSIDMFDKSSRGRLNTDSALKPSARKVALFYQTLHRISELIETRDFYIIKGVAHYKSVGTNPLVVGFEDLDAHILLHQFFISDSLVDFKQTIPDLHIDEMSLLSKDLDMQVRNYRFSGTRRISQGQVVHVSTKSGLDITARNFHWNLLDWNTFQKTKGIRIDSLHIDELVVRSPTSGKVTAPGTPKDSFMKGLPLLHIANLQVDKIIFNGDTPGRQAHFSGRNLSVDSLRSEHRLFYWGRVGVNLYDIGWASKKAKITIADMAFNSNRESMLRNLQIESDGGQDQFNLSIPFLTMNVHFRNTDFRQSSILSMAADNAGFSYGKVSGKDSLQVKGTLKIQAKNLNAFSDSNKFLSYDQVEGEWKDMRLEKARWQLTLPMSSVSLSNGYLALDNAGKLTVYGAIGASWKNISLEHNGDGSTLSVSSVSGSFKDPAFVLHPGVSLTWQNLAMKTSVTGGRIHYAGKKWTADGASLTWDPTANILRLKQFSLLPVASRDETFRTARWQGDYLTVNGGSLMVSGVRFGHSPVDSLFHVNKLTLEGIVLTASRDKRLPFRHGIEKPMPTKLIDQIPLSLKVDSIWIHHSSVTYNEYSLATGQWSSIPIRGINGYITSFTSRNNQKDSLRLLISGQLLDAPIRYLSYAESYGDPLSGFSAKTSFSPFVLPPFSQVLEPAAAVRITKGSVDTAYSSWRGNKFAAYGTMNFFYSGLRIKVLDKTDVSKAGIKPTLETWGVNLLLPNQRKKSSAIFFERDREKFIFNYWVKAQTSGVISTFGIKKNSAYAKLFQKKYAAYSLPDNAMAQWAQ